MTDRQTIIGIAGNRRRFLAKNSLSLIASGFLMIEYSSIEARDRPWPTSYGRNWEEARVGEYTLPDPLVLPNGRVFNERDWLEAKRPAILERFSTLMYGRTPDLPIKLESNVIAVRADAVGGLATRKIVGLAFFDDPTAPRIQLMTYFPNGIEEPVPVFVGLNWYGNNSVEADPAIPLSNRWMRPSASHGIVANRATEASRGVHASRWPLRSILENGIGLATFYYGDVEPDHLEGWRDGIRGYVAKREGRKDLNPNEWGALGAWAWGMSRVLDYLETIAAADSRHFIAIGHSRHGKATLWAGAQDDRFAIVISNNSGEGGTSLARRNFGENIAYSIAHASWRYCEKFRDFIGRAADLPFDQHYLIASIAPRPVYVASASEDLLADPKGEFLSALHAEPVYQLFERNGLGNAKWPPEPNRSIGDRIGYHLRSGDHDITQLDWNLYLEFAKRHTGVDHNR